MSTSRKPGKSRQQTRIATWIVAAVIVATGYYFGRDGNGDPRGPGPGMPAPDVANPDFEILEGCRLIDNGGNDGDSFRMRHGGVEHTFRLYFVDTPETSLRYPDRVGYQARYFDITPEQAVAIGAEAKKFTLDLLRKHPFVVLTRWEKVMKSYRYHAFVQVEEPPGDPVYLSEILVKEGLARIYTLPADLPDGTSKDTFKSHLKSLEAEAKTAGTGAWRF